MGGKKETSSAFFYSSSVPTEVLYSAIVIWYYKNGMSAHRFFANRHEEAIWLSKTNKYFFDLDSVRVPFDEATKELYKKDKRLVAKNIDKRKTQLMFGKSGG